VNTALIPPGSDLIQEICNQLPDKLNEYSSYLVVFPGKRPCHFLRKTLARRTGKGFLPPHTLSMDEFIDHVNDQVLGLRTRKLETIDAVSVLYEIHRKTVNPLGKKSFLNPDSFFPLGLKIYRDIEEFLIENISPFSVKNINHLAVEKLPVQTAQKLQTISIFYEEFYKKIGDSGYSTRASRYRAVAEKIDEKYFTGFEKLVFAGFFALTKTEQQLFKNMLRWDNTLFIFQDGLGMKDNIKELGITVESEENAQEPTVHFYKCPDTHGQVFGAGSIITKKIESNERPDKETVIVLPSSGTLFPLYHHVLSLFEPEQFNISLGYPLYRTPLFGFFNNLMELITTMDGERFYIPDYLTFVLHPYTKNIYFKKRTDITRMLFHAIEEALIDNRTKRFLSLDELEDDREVRKSLDNRILQAETDISLQMLIEHLRAIHANTIGKMRSFRNVKDFAEKITDVALYIYNNSTARFHPLFYPYSEWFLSQMDIISKSLMKDVRFDVTASYFNLLRKYMMICHVPFEGTPLRGLQVLGLLETRNIRFRKVFMLDMNEGIIPDTFREDSILPFKARTVLGLPTYLDREKLIAYYFDTLIKGAEEIHLFYVENDRMQRSRFIEKLLWERQKRDLQKDEAEYIQAVQYTINLKSDNPEPVGKTPEMVSFLKSFTFSASALDTYLSCPLRFYYRNALKVSEKEEVSDELEKSDIGNFVHKVLEDFFRNKTGRTLTEKDMNIRELDRIINRKFAEWYGDDPAGQTFLLKQQIKKHLNEFIRQYQLPKIKEQKIKILSIEQRQIVTIDSFKLYARMDRIEKRDDRRVIMDYKTSSSRKYLSINFNKLDVDRRDTWADSIGTLQLPFYLMVYSEYARQKPETIDSMFLLLGKTTMDKNIELTLFPDGDDVKARYALLRGIIFSLLQEITDPAYPFHPTLTPQEDCERCEYKYICFNQR
jgi:CRISPR/Cas system-associated exonuclease Cas4 (RecB family)